MKTLLLRWYRFKAKRKVRIVDIDNTTVRIKYLYAYITDTKIWQLPTREHLKLIAEHIHEVNALIKANGGYEIRGWHWTADKYDKVCAWRVNMGNGYTYDSKDGDYYVRAVSAFQN